LSLSNQFNSPSPILTAHLRLPLQNLISLFRSGVIFDPPLL
jgi:hypothetical protein